MLLVVGAANFRYFEDSADYLFQKRAPISIDTLSECATEHQANLLDSLNEILQQLPGTRIFVTGIPQILPEIERRLPEV